jgi:hypothetical protein
MVPGFIFVVGVALSFWVCMGRLGHSALDVIWALVAVELAAGIALPITLYAQRTPKLKFLVKGPLRSWLVLLILVIGALMGMCPWLRDVESMAWMFIPLFFAVVLMAKIWGPLHDRFVMGRR